MKIQDFLTIAGIAAAYAFSFNRKWMLKKIGEEILGDKNKKYAVLELKDVSYNRLFGLAGEIIASLFLDPIWSLINWIAALRAYRALYSDNRELTMRIVFNTLMQKETPAEVWKAFFRNSDTKKYYNDFKKYQGLLTPRIKIDKYEK